MEKYRVLAELGEGGMANVYLSVARGPAGFNKLLVLKAIKQELALDADLLAMFLDEARLAARLSHPNVVQTLEVGELGERPAIVMEYLDGQSLANVLGKPESRGVSLAMKLRILAAALEGLHYIHDLADFDGTPLELVHRDVSPHNIFVTFDGQVKVLDFGIAKGLLSQGTTRTDVLKGKIRYMAPEQMDGQAVDRRADIFSAGVVLWEIVTGQRIWHGRSEVNIMNAVLREGVPAPKTIDPSVPAALNDICVKALARAPSDRYSTAAELLAALDGVLSRMGPPVVLKQVGRLLGEAFASSRARTSALIDAELKTNDGEATHERLIVPPRIMALANETTTGTGTRTATVEIASAPPPSHRGRWSALALALGLGALLGGSLTLRRPASPTVIAAPAASAALTAIAAPPPAAPPSAPASSPSSVASAPPSPSASPSVSASAAHFTGVSTGVKVVAPPRPARQTAAPLETASAASAASAASNRAPSAENSHCSPPFYFDEQGIKRLKPECF